MASLQKKEETNWNRACRLLLEGGKDILVHYLQDYWSTNNHQSLDTFLADHKTILTSHHVRRYIHKPQIDILFPTSRSTRLDEWDITLAAAVARNCIPNKTPGQSNSLDRITKLRNTLYGHVNKMEMDDTEFTHNWTEICAVLTQAAGDFGLTQQQFDLQSKADIIKKTLVVDGDALRKQLHDWYSSDIVQGQADIKMMIQEGREEQRKETSDIKSVICRGMKEQKEVIYDIKTQLEQLKTGQDNIMQKATDTGKHVDMGEQPSFADHQPRTQLPQVMEDFQITSIADAVSVEQNSKINLAVQVLSTDSVKTYTNSSDKKQSYFACQVADETASTWIRVYQVPKRTMFAPGACLLLKDVLKKTGAQQFWCPVTTKICPSVNIVVPPNVKENAKEQPNDVSPTRSLNEAITTISPSTVTGKVTQVSPLKMFKDNSLPAKFLYLVDDEKQSPVKVALFGKDAEQQYSAGDVLRITDTFPYKKGQSLSTKKSAKVEFLPIDHINIDVSRIEQSSDVDFQEESQRLEEFEVIDVQNVKCYTCCNKPKLQTLQSNLVKYYKKTQIMSPLIVHSSSRQASIEDIYSKPHLVLVDHGALTKEIVKVQKIDYQDIIKRDTEELQHIYISGDAGVGKTSLCKHLIASWCHAHSHESRTDDQDIMPIMKQFDFLFYVTLRHAKGQYEMHEMIVSQLLAQILKQRSIKNSREEFLEELFEQYSERCLIVLDGLDEWTAPRDSALPSVSNGLPGRSLLMNYTIVTTTRPWKLAALRLQDTEIDKKIKLRGVEKVKDLGEKLVNIYNKQQDGNKAYGDFETQLEREGLSKMKATPVLLKQLICLWYNDHPFGISKTDVYTNMVDLLFERAEMREHVTEFNVRNSYTEVGLEQRHPCFKKGGLCEKYRGLLLDLGKVAFETMFSGAVNTQLVFESSEVEELDIHRRDIDTCVTVGILTKDIVPDMVRNRESLSFLHKTFHEYFAALYMSVQYPSISDLETRVEQKCRYLDSMFDMSDMFHFLSGMCPSLMKSLSGCLVEAINNYEVVEDERHMFKGRWYLHRIQSMILSCCKESSNNGHDTLCLPVTDISYHLDRFVNNDTSTLMQCLQEYPLQLRSIILTSRKATLKRLNIDIQSETAAVSHNIDKLPYHIDLSKYNNLQSVVVECEVASQISLKVNEDKLTHLSLEKVNSSLILSTVKAASKLKTLRLHSDHFTDCNETPVNKHMDSSQLSDHDSREGNRVDLDLSGHKELRKVSLGVLSLRSMTLSPWMRELLLCDIHTLTHDGLSSLISSISNTQSLEGIRLTSIKCKDHASVAGCRYDINLSEHKKLMWLVLDEMSPVSLTMSPFIRDITLHNIDTLTHDALCSLMSSISNTHSLQVIRLVSVKCGDHANGAGCGYEINLSKHTRLRRLNLVDISPGKVTLSTTVRKMDGIVMRNINAVSHESMCSLMSLTEHKPEGMLVDLDSVRCVDYKHGINCTKEIASF